eukprot:NODE_5870_length_548_cov_255.904665.p4 GENE.NODE_5870_length_548_cov_255.904665~~NODE_5870_length_548_cov_255.904665.p4  ORF type:complete len:123 (-),score=25.37 NODE_5870_length_548_cov_255.904665:65-433(-)
MLAACHTHGDTGLATVLLYTGVPALAGATALALFARPLLAQPRFRLQRLRVARQELLPSAAVLALLGWVVQDPANIGVCQPGGPWYTHTHALFHILTAAALYLLWYLAWTDTVVAEPPPAAT